VDTKDWRLRYSAFWGTENNNDGTMKARQSKTLTIIDGQGKGS